MSTSNTVCLTPLYVEIGFRPTRISSREVRNFTDSNCVKLDMGHATGVVFDSLEDAMPTLREKASSGKVIQVNLAGRISDLEEFVSLDMPASEGRDLGMLRSLLPEPASVYNGFM